MVAEVQNAVFSLANGVKSGTEDIARHYQQWFKLLTGVCIDMGISLNSECPTNRLGGGDPNAGVTSRPKGKYSVNIGMMQIEDRIVS